MRTGGEFIKKDFESSVNTSTPTDEDMQKINALTRKTLKADDVYVFNLVLCDNEIDRDFERFSIASLNTLASLYVGKTGIFDHSMKGADQVARIFETRVETENGKKTKASEDYTKLVARAYMPKTEKNKDLIVEIDAGIKKEISVGCAVGSIYCSECGADLKKSPCKHKRGRYYGKNICHSVLSSPTDAYEWSFVAVPSQIGAGVSKSFDTSSKGGEKKVDDILERFKNVKSEMTVTKEDIEQLNSHLDALEKKAQIGEMYCESLRQDIVKLCALTIPQIKASVLDSLLKNAAVDELIELKVAFSKKGDELIPPTVQLKPQKKKENINSDFKF